MSETPMKTIDEQALVGARIELVDFGLPADTRCDRCCAQAYVEVEIFDKTTSKKLVFLMCAHHYSVHEAELVLRATRVIDHRPFLLVQEQAFKGLITSK